MQSDNRRKGWGVKEDNIKWVLGGERQQERKQRKDERKSSGEGNQETLKEAKPN